MSGFAVPSGHRSGLAVPQWPLKWISSAAVAIEVIAVPQWPLKWISRVVVPIEGVTIVLICGVT